MCPFQRGRNEGRNRGQGAQNGEGVTGKGRLLKGFWNVIANMFAGLGKERQAEGWSRWGEGGELAGCVRDPWIFLDIAGGKVTAGQLGPHGFGEGLGCLCGFGAAGRAMCGQKDAGLRQRPAAIVAGLAQCVAGQLRQIRVETERGQQFCVDPCQAAGQDLCGEPAVCHEKGIDQRAIRRDLLKKAECQDVCIIGPVKRPDFSKLKLDWTGTKLLPRVLNAARKGDDALLSFFVRWMEEQGFAVVGAEDVLGDLVAPEGAVGNLSPDDTSLQDIELGQQVVHALDDLDVGQGAITCDGLVLAVEAAEGTDEMLRRTARLPQNVRGTQGVRRGVLVKLPKPSQDRRVDLPMMGTTTVELAAAAGLAGIAIEAGGAIVFDREEVARLANEAGMFVYAFPKSAAKQDQPE